jgi:hypothetical protein
MTPPGIHGEAVPQRWCSSGRGRQPADVAAIRAARDSPSRCPAGAASSRSRRSSGN